MLLPPLNLSMAEVSRRKGSAKCLCPTGASSSVLKEVQCPKTSHRPRASQPKPNLPSFSKRPACPRSTWASIAVVKAFTPSKSRLGGKPSSPARSRRRLSKKKIGSSRTKTRNVSMNLSANCAAKTRRSLKQPRCWCCEKSSTTTGGQLTSLPQRQLFIDWLSEAVAAGARKITACREVGLSLRTLQRWTGPEIVQADGRTTIARPAPCNALSEVERQAIVTLCNSADYAHLPPSQIVPRLADQGRYLASEATFYRVLRMTGQQHHRGRSQRPRRQAAPTTHAAKGPNQVWSWDITYLPSPIRGKYYCLYLIEDIYSRKAVGWEVYDVESGEKAAELLQRSVIGEQCLREPLVLHSDNGAPMKSVTLLSKMYELGIMPSRDRPRVSNDNPYSESLFRTLKYCPQWPQNGFASLDAARAWVRDFMRWYNNEHHRSRRERHS